MTWPLFPDNQPIRSGLPPETGATLQIYNWVAYVNQACLNSFAKKYNCKVQLTTFNTMDEAMSKLRSGSSFDVFMGVTVDVLGQLIESKLIQPLNHSYIPNIAQAWPDFTNPFYDRGWQYTVPYTIYTTGMAWRKDLVHENPYAMRNPWAMPWQPKYKGKVAILDDYREGISLGLMKNGHLRPEHHRPAPDRAVPAVACMELSEPGERADRQQRLHRGPDRRDLDPPRLVGGHGGGGLLHAQGRAGRTWSATGSPPTAGARWRTTPTPCCAAATNPVLAHLFLELPGDLPNVLENISFNGYMQPLNEVTPQRLVKEKILPPSLISTVVLPSYFRRGVGELQLPVDADALWQQAWLVVSNGI